jgi:DNA-binding transcriptional MerR regulator
MKHSQNSGSLTIGVLAQRTGLAVSAIRYYEEVGLIEPAARRESGHRFYGDEAQKVLTLVRHCRELGFSIEETRELVSLSKDESKDCVEAREVAQIHLRAVRKKLLELHTLEANLAKFVQACTEQCVGGPAPQCSILKDIRSSPSQDAVEASCCG